MLRIPPVPVRYDAFRLTGGVDMITPTLSLRPGIARESVNFEVSETGGYTRIAGYERFDGRPSPSSSVFGVVTLDAVAELSVGNTIQNLAATVTGKVIALSGLNVVYTKAVGSFATGDAVYVGATPIGTVQAVAAFSPDAKTQAEYRLLARDEYRADIGPVPGSGPVRGVVYHNGTVYAWRDNAGGTAVVLHKSTSSGWASVSLGWELGFNTGASTAIAEGDTVSNLAGTASGVVARVVLESGTTWVGGSGRLILSSTTGTWAASDQIRVGGVQRATATGAASAITLLPGGRVEAVQANLSGASGAVRVYGCDGANRAFEFDGTTYAPIRTGMAADAPTHIAVHRNAVFLAFGASLQNSGVGTPFVWSPIFGANELALPEEITALVPMPGGSGTPAMAVTTKSNTHILYGSPGASDLQLVSYDQGVGAAAYSVQRMSDAFMHDDRGITQLTAGQNFGNFDANTLTYPLRPFVAARIGQVTASGLNRAKSQYRVYYRDGWGLYVTVVNGRLLGCMPVQYPTWFNCWCEGESAQSGTVSYAGGGDGYVYRLDIGPDFDGGLITANMQLNFNAQGAARVLKRYRRASLEVAGEGYATIDFGYTLGYNSPSIDQAPDASYATAFSGSSWDSFTWDAFTWDGRTLSPSEVECNGTAENISVAIRSNSKINESFTVNSVTLHYTVRRGIR